MTELTSPKLLSSDEEDKKRLEELSKQLNEGMTLSKGQKENTKFKLVIIYHKKFMILNN